MRQAVIQLAKIDMCFKRIMYIVALLCIQCFYRIFIGIYFLLAIAHQVQRLMSHYAVYPASSRTTCSIKTAGLAPDIDEGVMQHIFSQCTLPHDAQGNAQQALAVLPVYLL